MGGRAKVRIAGSSALVILFFLLGAMPAFSGDLDDSAVTGASSGSPAAPAAYGYTLNDLYQKLHNGTAATAGGHSLAPSVNTSTATMYRISDIYADFTSDAASCTATASDVASGKVFFATTGTTRGTNFGPVTGSASSGGLAFPDTGQTASYTDTFGEDHDYQPSASQPSYTDNGDGTITDNRTGLMWLKDASNYNSGSSQTWENALSGCESFTYAGYSDWRLPNVRELMSIVNYGTYSPAINTTYFSNTQSGGYWSSTTYASSTSYAWHV
ncbi:MAG: DUF1566 domain-containing protein, partial [Candidatus Omnitrophica bacterium]|nr:DUF1566 domain-containing protein [Candidatus Omnitrophota bacterium]